MTASGLFCEPCGRRCATSRWEDAHTIGVALDGIYANGPRWKVIYDFDSLDAAMWRCSRCSALLRMDRTLAARVGRAYRLVVPAAPPTPLAFRSHR